MSALVRPLPPDFHPRTPTEEVMLRENEWEHFRGYSSKGVALSVSKQLEVEGVPNRIEARSLESGVEAEYWIVVQCSLAHRARWIRAQLPPEPSELDYLATRRLDETE